MKKFAATIAAAALALTGCAATTPIATQAWVMRKLAEFSRPEDATVKTNANMSVTYSSKAYFEDVPQCVGVSLTVRSVRRGFRTSWNTPAPTFLNFMLSTAWAAYPDHVTQTLTIHVDSGAWYELDAAGNQFAHPFNLGDGMDLTAEIDLPDMPDGRHTCNIGDDCNCECAGKTLDDVTFPGDLERLTPKEAVDTFGKWDKWIDKENPPEDVVVKDRRGEKKYYLTDLDGILLNLDNLQKSSAWALAIQDAMTVINDYIDQAREAYAAAYICPEENPQHDFSEWVKTGADPNVIHYERECARCGKVDHKDDPCVHVWGKWNEIGRGDGVVTYMAICTICTANKTKAEPIPPFTMCDEEKDEHYPASGDECGCICGKYGKNGLASSDKSFHKWADTENGDGIKICVCKCGQFHVRREPTTYLVNSRRACAAICAYCNEKSGDGIGVGKALDEEHTPCEVKDARCGCLCGTLTANNTDLEQFHIQKPGTCRCFGSDGSGNGKWHFHCPRSGCTKICQYLIDGNVHLAAKKNEIGFEPAHASDHTKYNGAGCGCICGEINASSSSADLIEFHNQNPNACGCYCQKSTKYGQHRGTLSTCRCFCGDSLWQGSHIWGDDCYCKCSDRKHRIKQRPDHLCIGVCHGSCGQASRESYKNEHTPSENGCGCECGAFGGDDYANGRFHNGRGTPSCMCSCGRHHEHSKSRPDCSAICALCGDGKTNYAFKDPITPAPSSAHTFPDGQCACACGKYREHSFSGASCTCYCGQSYLAHNFVKTYQATIDSRICERCGNEVDIVQTVYSCTRCGARCDTTDETGHAPICGKSCKCGCVGCGCENCLYGNGKCTTCGGMCGIDFHPCGCGCVGCKCSACKSRNGTCTECGRSCGENEIGGGGDGGGGGSDSFEQSGDPDSIL